VGGEVVVSIALSSDIDPSDPFSKKIIHDIAKVTAEFKVILDALKFNSPILNNISKTYRSAVIYMARQKS
jgi:hypothetical protein